MHTPCSFCTHFFYNSQCQKLHIHYKQSNRKNIEFSFLILFYLNRVLPRLVWEYTAILPLQCPKYWDCRHTHHYVRCNIQTYIHVMFETGFHYKAMVGLELHRKTKLASNSQMWLSLTLSLGLKMCIKGVSKI